MSAGDAYIRRLDPDWIDMVTDVNDAKTRIAQLVDSNHRQERYLVGGWNADGTEYVLGVRDKVEAVARTVRWFWAIAAGVWCIFAIIAADVIHTWTASGGPH